VVPGLGFYYDFKGEEKLTVMFSVETPEGQWIGEGKIVKRGENDSLGGEFKPRMK
jgi:hypothetical protein